MPRQYTCHLAPLHASLHVPPWTATTTPQCPSTHSGPHAHPPTTYPRFQAHSQRVAVAPYTSHTVPTNPGPGRHVSASPACLDHGVWGHTRYGHREPGPHFRAAWDGLAGVWGPGRCARATGHVSVHAGSTRRLWRRVAKRELTAGRRPGSFSQPKVVGLVADVSWGMPKGMGTSSGVEDACCECGNASPCGGQRLGLCCDFGRPRGCLAGVLEPQGRPRGCGHAVQHEHHAWQRALGRDRRCIMDFRLLSRRCTGSTPPTCICHTL